ncbi:MAG: CpaF family protein [Dethiobacteria bacterium]|jgi:pilus assembly protein CpaF
MKLPPQWAFAPGGKEPVTENYGLNRKKEWEGLITATLRRVLESPGKTPVVGKMDAQQKIKYSAQISVALEAVLKDSGLELSRADKEKIAGHIYDEACGYGPINPLLRDPTISEIMVNGPGLVYVEQKGKIIKTGITFCDNAHLLETIDKIVTPLGRRLDEKSPMVDARLPDGSRVNAIIPPLALKGPALTIRKFAAKPLTPGDLINFGTMTGEIARLFKSAVLARLNIIVSGGTGSGKTTTLNVLSGFIPEQERIVTIEDAAELQLHQEHVVTLESRPPDIEGHGEITIRDLVINSLRMRPDRIVVGEVRGGEALDMLQAMNTGHDGSISTLHANNPRDALARLETMVLMAGINLPLRAIREQVASAIDLIIQQSRLPDGSRKIVKVSEVAGMEGDIITLQDIFIFEQTGFNERGRIAGKHVPTGIIPRNMEKLQTFGEKLPKGLFGAKNFETAFRRH